MSNPEFNGLSIATQAIQAAGSGGVFLVSGINTPNVMTLGWALSGVIWTKPVFAALVRPSRYTFGLIEEHKEFTVCIPPAGEMRKELGVCGSKSGRDLDKVKECALTLKPAKTVSVPVIGECELFLECRVLGKTEMNLEQIDESLAEKFYSLPSGGYGNGHVMLFGEILAAYRTE